MIHRLSILSLILLAVSASAAEIRLRSGAVCGGSVARIADVAEIFAPDHRVADALAEIPLCPTPPAGQSRVLSQEDFRQLLVLSGVDRKTATITGSESVTITREGASRTSPAAKQPMIASGIRQATLEVEPPPAPAKSKSVRPASFDRPDMDDMKPIAPDKTDDAPLIDKGDSVTVLARTAGIRITASAKAIDSGDMGESIGVELIDTKQKIVGRIVGPQTVEVTTETSSRK